MKELLKKFLPAGLFEYIRIMRNRHEFKYCKIDSAYVCKGAKLEDHITIPKNCIIQDNVSIGRYTYMQMGCNINNAVIGRFCSLGDNVLVGPWSHPLDRVSTSPRIYREILQEEYEDMPDKTEIGNDVWIGSNAVIMGGVHVGDGAVIGASAVVTKDVPAYAIAVGNPARVIRYRFDENETKKLQVVQWWTWEDKEIQGKGIEFLNNLSNIL